MTDIKFCEDLTFEEWRLLQDKNSLEFKAIETCHKTHPGFNLEEIKTFIYTNIIETEINQKICMESFSERHVNSQKLNEQMSRLCRIIFSQNSDFSSVDKRGHGDSISVKLGGRGRDAETISFRIEEKAIRHAHYLVEHNIAGVPTATDLVRKGFSKYMEMLPIIREIEDAITNRFMLDIEAERENLERIKVNDMLKTFDARLAAEEEDMIDILTYPDNKEELEEIRDWTTKFIKETLSYTGPTKKEIGRVKKFIMNNSRLYNILTTIERHGLISREYIDSIRQKGIVPADVDIIFKEEMKANGNHS